MYKFLIFIFAVFMGGFTIPNIQDTNDISAGVEAPNIVPEPETVGVENLDIEGDQVLVVKKSTLKETMKEIGEWEEPPFGSMGDLVQWLLSTVGAFLSYFLLEFLRRKFPDWWEERKKRKVGSS